MKKIMTACISLLCSSALFAMSDSQIDRLAETQMKQIEANARKEFQTKKCLAEKLLDVTNSNVRSVEVYSLRHRSIVENVITNIFVDDASNYRVQFAFVLDSKKVKVTCGIWAHGGQSDLFQHCVLENGKKLNISKYHSSIVSPNDWFVIEKGCLED